MFQPADYAFFKIVGAIRVHGPDTRSYLQGQFSNQIHPGKQDAAVYGLWLNVKGKILADSYLLSSSSEEYLVLSPDCGTDRLSELVSERIIMDEVEVEPAPDSYRGALLGNDLASALLKELQLAERSPGDHVAFDGGWAFRVEADPLGAWVLALRGTEGEAIASRLGALAASCGGRELTVDERRIACWRAGRFAVGDGALAGDLPQEAGLDEWAVSFNKGCYIGQEVMARLKSMGRARRHLAVAHGWGAVPESLPAGLVDSVGKRAGELRQAVAEGSGWTGVAMIKDGSVGVRLAADPEKEVVIPEAGR